MSEPLTAALRERVIAAMPWYDESNPDYSELDAVLLEALDAARTPALDVGLLAQALKKWGGPSIDGDGRRTAKTIAREYAALSTPPESVR